MAGLETSSPTISWSYSTLVAVACSARRPVPSWVCSTHHLPCGHITRCVFMSYRLTPRLWSPYCRCCSHDYLLGKLASIAFYWQWKHRRTLFPLRLSITVGCLSSGWAHQCWRLPGSPGNGYLCMCCMGLDVPLRASVEPCALQVGHLAGIPISPWAMDGAGRDDYSAPGYASGYLRHIHRLAVE